MNLDETQRAQVRIWIVEGAKLSEIQSRLASELGLRLTYMETRLLMDDLQLHPKDTESAPSDLPESSPLAAPSSAAEPEVPVPSTPADIPSNIAEDGVQEPGDVAITVDQVTRAGALVSGKVTFSDSKKAEWYLDQYGRLGIAPQEQGYKPSQADLMLFQGELQSALSKMGY